MLRTVAICIPTYQRPGGLSRLLSALALQAFPPGIETRIIVVDNEGSTLTRKICEAGAHELSVPLLYCAEPRRGISFARNKAIEAARPFADFIVFIDDDEIPSERWLEHLIVSQEKYQADAVAGPVIPRFMSEAPRWMRDGHFFEWQRHATGTRVQDVGTGNVLLTLAAITRVGGFDPKYALTGGEDAAFFASLTGAGGRIVWSDEAIVEEWVPASRAKMKWLLQRAYRLGTTYGLRSRERKNRAEILVRGAVRCTKGACLTMAFLFLGRSATVKALQRILSGAGMISSALGYQYEEYRRVHSL